MKNLHWKSAEKRFDIGVARWPRFTARVVLLSETATDVQARVYCQGQLPPTASAAEAAASRITARTGHRSKVRVELIPCQTFSTFQPGDPLPGRTPWR
jgi:hypothetical protein